jgi:hypothetical protein
MKAVTASVWRRLIATCVSVAVCLMVVVALSSAAQAHAGHKHRATEQPAVGGTVSAAVERPASLPLMADTNAPRSRILHLVPVPPVELEAFQEILVDGAAVSPKGLCTCGGLCGSCTSMSCCVAVLASHGSATFVPRTGSAPISRAARFIAGAAVPLLQRPPIQVC